MPTTKQIRAKRARRVRDYGLSILIVKYGRDIVRASFKKKDVVAMGERAYHLIAAGITPKGFYQHNQSRVNNFLSQLPLRMQKALNMGAEKVVDTKGKKLQLDKPSYKKQIDALTRSNMKYLKKIQTAQKNKMLDIISKGIKEGKPYSKMSAEIAEKVKGISTYRANLIARTETHRAVAQSMRDTLKHNGFKQYIWLTANDDRVDPKICEPRHRKVYSTKNGPLPVKDSHPNCRCVIVKA